MPALPPVPAVARCSLLWTDSADLNVETILHYRYTGGPPNTAACQALAADLYAAYSPLTAHLDDNSELRGATVTDLSSNTGASADHLQVTVGTAGTNQLSASACTLALYSIARRYRGGKPRSYFPLGVASDLNQRQNWQGSYITAVQGLVAAARTAFIGANFGGTTISDQVSVSYYSGSRVVISPTTGRAKNVSIPRGVPLIDVIVGTTISTRVASQRRRNGK